MISCKNFMLICLLLISSKILADTTIHVDTKENLLKLNISQIDGKYNFSIDEQYKNKLTSQIYPMSNNRVDYLGDLDYVNYDFKLIDLVEPKKEERYYNFSEFSVNDTNHKNYFSIITSQDGNPRFNFFFVYQYSKKINKVHLEGIYYNRFIAEYGCDNFFTSKLDLDLKKLPFFYLDKLNRKEISYFIVNYLYGVPPYNIPMHEPKKSKNYDQLNTGDCKLDIEKNQPIELNLNKKILSQSSALSCSHSSNLKFFCELENKKKITICEENNSLQYKYGTDSTVELKYPNGNHQDNIYPNKKDSKLQLSFNNKGYSYKLQGEKFLSNPDYSSYKLSVVKDNKLLLEKSCLESYESFSTVLE